jgi:hypothetical protein
MSSAVQLALQLWLCQPPVQVCAGGFERTEDFALQWLQTMSAVRRKAARHCSVLVVEREDFQVVMSQEIVYDQMNV